MFYVLRQTSSGISSIPIRSIGFEKRIIYFDQQSANEPPDLFIEQMMYLNTISDEKITMFINADLKDEDTAIGICDMIRLSTSPIRTIVTGRASSLAAVIFICGDERLMFPGAELSVREKTTQSAGFVTPNQNSYDRILQQLQTNKRMEVEKMLKYQNLSSEEAVKLHFADSICCSNDLIGRRNETWI